MCLSVCRGGGTGPTSEPWLGWRTLEQETNMLIGASNLSMWTVFKKTQKDDSAETGQIFLVKTMQPGLYAL